jgi:hypothetical protein
MKKITLLFLLLIAYGQGFAQSPTDNATAPPARDAGDVISIYGADSASNPYTDITGVNYTPNWSQPAPWNVPDPAFDPGTGDLVLFYDELSYQGTDFAGNPQNAAGMEFLHVDIWTPDGQTINVSPINNGTGAGEVQVGIATTAGAWTSVDIPKASFAGMTWDSVFQFIFVRPGFGSPTPRADVYLDNIYFWKAPIAPGSDATLSDLQVDGESIPNFNGAAFDYTINLEVGTTTVPQITMATTTDPAATVTSITQAPGIPGDATVLVTSQNTSFTETYTVSFQATLPNSPPVPSTPDGEVVLSIYCDIPGYTNQYNVEGDFGIRNLVELGPDNNEVMELPLDAVGGGYGQFQNVRPDVSAAGFFNFSYFAPDVPPGTEGHQFGIMINSSADIFYDFRTDGAGDEDIVFNEWQNVSVPLSFFTAQGFDPTQFVVWKIAGPSSAFTSLVYFDNIYFSVNAGTVLSVEEETAVIDFNVYPNPTQNVWNIKTNNQNISSIQVFDVQGRQVLNIIPDSNNATIDASSLPSGLYFAKIKSESTSQSIKLIKN